MTAAEKPRWRVLFDQAVERAEGVYAVVADEMGISRTTVSLVHRDKYHASTDKFAQTVMDTYDAFPCDHLGERVTTNACRGFALRAAPTSSAREARHWRACQACPKRPNEE